jgi:S1-C subfamily serine protease
MIGQVTLKLNSNQYTDQIVLINSNGLEISDERVRLYLIVQKAPVLGESGIGLALHQRPDGLFVKSVHPDGAASKAGLRAGNRCEVNATCIQPLTKFSSASECQEISS